TPTLPAKRGREHCTGRLLPPLAGEGRDGGWLGRVAPAVPPPRPSPAKQGREHCTDWLLPPLAGEGWDGGWLGRVAPAVAPTPTLPRQAGEGALHGSTPPREAGRGTARVWSSPAGGALRHSQAESGDEAG